MVFIMTTWAILGTRLAMLKMSSRIEVTYVDEFYFDSFNYRHFEKQRSDDMRQTKYISKKYVECV